MQTPHAPVAFYQNLGRWLRQVREERGISQEKMGPLLDVAFQQIQKYENGANRIPVDKLVLFCKATGAKVVSAIRAAEGLNKMKDPA